MLKAKGTDRATYLFERLRDRLGASGAQVSAPLNTPYINTIPAAQEPAYPGNLEIERRIRSLIRWNAMAMVVKGNKQHQGIGGHISTFASAATLYEVAFHHFLRGKDAPQGGVGFSRAMRRRASTRAATLKAACRKRRCITSAAS